MTDKPSGNMRWLWPSIVYQEGAARLQQEWIIYEESGQTLKETRREWRDIPIEVEA